MTDSFATFKESHCRCSKDPTFLELFYEKFLSSSDKVRQKFAGTDMSRQKKALEQSLRMVVMSSRGSDAAEAYLDYIASRHGSKDLDIEPELYELWLDALIETVSELDPDYSNTVELAWRDTMHYAIDYMVSRY